MGGHRCACSDCGGEVFRFHSCNHRLCPRCGGADTHAWLEHQLSRLLPVPYFLVTFTVPEALRLFARDQPEGFLDALFDESAATLQEIAAHPRPTAYWLRDNPQAGDSRRVPASDLLHVYLAENPEQMRGIPWMHASMLAMHDLGEFTRSALLNARRSADVLGYLVSPDGTGNAVTDETDAAGQPIKINAPGTYDVLPEGYDIRTPDYNYPNTVFEPFTKAIMRRVASGLDVAAHNLTGDMTDVNYSSARIAELEERDQWMTLQNWFIGALLEPVYATWYARAMTAGIITMPNGSPLPLAKADKFRAHEWQPRRWAWVDPMKDIEAARLAVKSGIASPQMIAAQNGVDVEDVLDAIAAFETLAKSKGVALVDYGSSAATAAPDPTRKDPP